jgi:hypothetical protein
MSSATAFALQLPAPSDTAAGRYNAHLLNVMFEGPDGDRRSAIGGGESIREAIAAARDELPAGVVWAVVRWSPLFGE